MRSRECVIVMTATATKARPDDLMRSVVLLTPAELSEFVLRFDEWRFRQLAQADKEAARLADTHRLPIDQRARVAELLTKNREEGLTAEEEVELDGHLGDMDQRLVAVAGELTRLTDRAKTSSPRGRS